MFRLLCFTGELLVCLSLVGLVPESAPAYTFHRENMVTQFGNGIATSSHANTTVFVILMENHRWADIFRNPDAPYINRTGERVFKWHSLYAQFTAAHSGGDFRRFTAAR
jgi:hypothetical protein